MVSRGSARTTTTPSTPGIPLSRAASGAAGAAGPGLAWDRVLGCWPASWPVSTFVSVAPVLARELETGTFRYAWTQGFGRWRWALAKLVLLAIAVAAAAGAFSVLFSWYNQPFFAAGYAISFATRLFRLPVVAFAAWTLAAFAIGVLAGVLIRRGVPAIAATRAVYAGP